MAVHDLATLPAGRLLDYAVATAIGSRPVHYPSWLRQLGTDRQLDMQRIEQLAAKAMRAGNAYLIHDTRENFWCSLPEYSTAPSDGMPILQEWKIDLACLDPDWEGRRFEYKPLGKSVQHEVAGTTMLEAGLRCLCVWRLGPTLDIPDDFGQD